MGASSPARAPPILSSAQTVNLPARGEAAGHDKPGIIHRITGLINPANILDSRNPGVGIRHGVLRNPMVVYRFQTVDNDGRKRGGQPQEYEQKICFNFTIFHKFFNLVG